MSGTYLPNRAGRQARLEAAARQVVRAWGRGQYGPRRWARLAAAVAELARALDHPTDDGRGGYQ